MNPTAFTETVDVYETAVLAAKREIELIRRNLFPRVYPVAIEQILTRADCPTSDLCCKSCLNLATRLPNLLFLAQKKHQQEIRTTLNETAKEVCRDN